MITGAVDMIKEGKSVGQIANKAIMDLEPKITKKLKLKGGAKNMMDVGRQIGQKYLD